MSNKQKTLAAPISFSGRGLHTGLEINMTIRPAEEDRGLVFKRTDLESAPEIPALSDYVTDTSRSTTIEKDGVKITTVEHILAALWTGGVDNAVIEVDGPEVPIMDGSARDYAQAVDKVGLVEQNAEIQYYKVSDKISYKIEDKGVELEIYPDDEFSVSLHIDYGSKVLGNQYATFSAVRDSFKDEIAPCRTFVFLHEILPLIEHDLIKGGDVENAIVVVEKNPSEQELAKLRSTFGKPDIEIREGYLNNITTRFINEPARHKLLDILGDFALLGVRIKGKVIATRPGHRANTEMMKLLRKTMRSNSNKPQYQYDPNAAPVYDINDIKTMLPHRPPFLLVDKVIHVDENSIAGIKNVTMNEPFFTGHFPDEPVMPGVLIIEAMAQCGGILALHGLDRSQSYSTYFMKIDGVKFKNKVVPGDTLQFELRLTEPIRRGIVVMEAKAFVGSKLTTEATLMAQVIPTKK